MALAGQGFRPPTTSVGRPGARAMDVIWPFVQPILHAFAQHAAQPHNWHLLGAAWAHISGGLHRAAGSALAVLTALPRDCHLASLHTALISAGTDIQYVRPGFGPWAIGWGWYLVGCATGMAISIFIMLLECVI